MAYLPRFMLSFRKISKRLLSSHLCSRAHRELGHQEVLLALLLLVGRASVTRFGLKCGPALNDFLQPFGLAHAFPLRLGHNVGGVDGTLDVDGVVVRVHITIVIAKLLELLALGDCSLELGGRSGVALGALLSVHQFSHLCKI